MVEADRLRGPDLDVDRGAEVALRFSEPVFARVMEHASDLPDGFPSAFTSASYSGGEDEDVWVFCEDFLCVPEVHLRDGHWAVTGPIHTCTTLGLSRNEPS
jgi:hypothetical protein